MQKEGTKPKWRSNKQQGKQNTQATLQEKRNKKKEQIVF